MQRCHQRRRRLLGFYFAVEAVGVAVERVRQHGGAPFRGPAPVPGGGRIAMCLDLRGAFFGMASLPG